MKKIIFGMLLVVGCLLLVNAAGVSWGAATLDDVARDITAIKIDMAGVKAEMGAMREGIRNEITGLRTLMATLFAALFAAMAGLFYFVFDISKSLRVPKEERVAKLEEMMGRLRDYLAQVSEKLHLPKPIL